MTISDEFTPDIQRNNLNIKIKFIGVYIYIANVFFTNYMIVITQWLLSHNY